MRGLDRTRRTSRTGQTGWTALGLGLVLTASVLCRGVILFDSGDPEFHTTAPVETVWSNGWASVGLLGGFTGVPISSNFFVSATHVGTGTLNYKGSDYTVIGTWTDLYTDLRVSKVAERFPDWVELNRDTNEVGKLALVIGRGTFQHSGIRSLEFT